MPLVSRSVCTLWFYLLAVKVLFRSVSSRKGMAKLSLRKPRINLAAGTRGLLINLCISVWSCIALLLFVLLRCCWLNKKEPLTKRICNPREERDWQKSSFCLPWPDGLTQTLLTTLEVCSHMHFVSHPWKYSPTFLQWILLSGQRKIELANHMAVSQKWLQCRLAHWVDISICEDVFGWEALCSRVKISLQNKLSQGKTRNSITKSSEWDHLISGECHYWSFYLKELLKQETALRTGRHHCHIKPKDSKVLTTTEKYGEFRNETKLLWISGKMQVTEATMHIILPGKAPADPQKPWFPYFGSILKTTKECITNSRIRCWGTRAWSKSASLPSKTSWDLPCQETISAVWQ